MKNEEPIENRNLLGNGNGGKDTNWRSVRWSFYALELVTIVSAIILALLYVYLWWNRGLLFLVGAFVILVLSRWIVGQLVARPQLFTQKQWLLSGLQRTDSGLAIFHKALGYLHVRHARAIKWTGRKFMDLPNWWKVGIGGFATAAFIVSTLFVGYKTVEVVKSKLPYGKNRFQMTAEELASRKQLRINMAQFAVWGKKDADKSAKCMDQYKTLIYDEAIKNGITPQRFEGLLFVESFCDPTKVNGGSGPKGSGAAGLGQLMLDVGCERNLVMDKAFCTEVLKPKSGIKFIPKDRKIEDRRLQPKYSIPVSADILGDGKKYWGDENWAFVEYHMGVGNLRNLVMNYFDETTPGWRSKYSANFQDSKDPDKAIPREIVAAGITYDDIYFRCTPDRTPKTYALLRRLEDSSSTYVYTGLAATEGIALMRNNPKEFQAMYAKQQDPDGGEANRPMRAWWGNKLAKYQTRTDVLFASKSGELVPVQSNASIGYVLRTAGADRIGECDPGNEKDYYFTKKANAGALFLLASRVNEMGGDPIEVTGLIRTNEMYDKPVKKNGQGCLPQTQPRTHVIGSAFDIGANIRGSMMSKKTRDALEFVLMDLRADGIIDRIKEGTADHISYNPFFEKDLEEVYDRVMGGQSPLVSSQLVAFR